MGEICTVICSQPGHKGQKSCSFSQLVDQNADCRALRENERTQNGEPTCPVHISSSCCLDANLYIRHVCMPYYIRILHQGGVKPFSQDIQRLQIDVQYPYFYVHLLCIFGYFKVRKYNLLAKQFTIQLQKLTKYIINKIQPLQHLQPFRVEWSTFLNTFS